MRRKCGNLLIHNKNSVFELFDSFFFMTIKRDTPLFRLIKVNSTLIIFAMRKLWIIHSREVTK